jgi:hypothetical protein
MPREGDARRERHYHTLAGEGRTPFAPVGPTRGGSAAAIPSTASGLFSLLSGGDGWFSLGAAFGDGDADEACSPPRDRVRSENRDLLR